MISLHGNKFTSSDYKLGDKKMRGKLKTFDIVKGKYINRKETRYEVNYIDKKGKDRSDCFSVSAMTSVTRTIEKDRKRKAIIAKQKLVERCQVRPAGQFLEKTVSPMRRKTCRSTW